MLIRRSAFEQVGGFDEGYWMYMEDLDLSYRLAQAGWVSWYEPGATVTTSRAGPPAASARRGSTGPSTAACTASIATTTHPTATARRTPPSTPGSR